MILFAFLNVPYQWKVFSGHFESITKNIFDEYLKSIEIHQTEKLKKGLLPE